MPRPSGTRRLAVWMNGERVGTWTLRRGEQLFHYAPEWLASPLRRPLSLSMPLRPSDAPYRTEVVHPWFDNLLPDSDDIRRRMMTRFGTRHVLDSVLERAPAALRKVEDRLPATFPENVSVPILDRLDAAVVAAEAALVRA